jgi:hypothetical protein
MTIIDKMKGLVDRNINIFTKQAYGEPCHVCKLPMERVMVVGTGEKMHPECWGTFCGNALANLGAQIAKDKKRMALTIHSIDGAELWVIMENLRVALGHLDSKGLPHECVVRAYERLECVGREGLRARII